MSPRLFLPLLFVGVFVLFQGCASPHAQSWNHYEKGMLLVFKGYDVPEEGKVDKVEKHFNKAIELNENLPGVHASLGTYKASRGDAESARELWKKEVKLHKESKTAMDIALESNQAVSEGIEVDEEKAAELKKEAETKIEEAKKEKNDAKEETEKSEGEQVNS